MQKIFMASDHAAVEEKDTLTKFLSDKFEVIDLGPMTTDSVHYPNYGFELANTVVSEKALGVALCGSGIGISMAANRIKGARAALCRDVEDAKICKEHNNANIICFGARRNSIDEMKEMLTAWIDSIFEGGRHQIRVDLLDK